MATFLSSALLLAALLQAPVPGGPPDSLAAIRDRAARDSTDAELWLLMGRAYLELGAEAHGPGHRAPEDSAWARAVLDTADGALTRAAVLAGPLGKSAVGDSARVLRVGTWAARNTGTITRFDKCLAKAGDRADVAACISRFANDVRP